MILRQHIQLHAGELHRLNESLHYMKMSELRELCLRCDLPAKGNKVALIERIIIFIETGKVTEPQQIPPASKAKKGGTYKLEPDALMLYGAYKNDAKTRAFFKNLIGDYFHFTAFGIDWLNECWHAGNPPTYKEFAEYWKHEYERRRSSKPAPKKEWAYINFVQRFLLEHPEASKNDVNQAWEAERQDHVNIVKKLLKLF